MRKFILSLVAATSLLLCADVVAENLVSTSVFSRHVWRGQGGPASVSIQPTVNVASTGTAIGTTAVQLWAQIPIIRGETEYDFIVSQDLGENASLAITSYYYDGPLLDGDNHDIEVGVSTSFAGVDAFVGRFVSGDEVKDDTYVELGYDLDGRTVFVGGGDGGYSEGGGFSLVNVGVSVERGEGYGASFIYNPDTETPYLVVRKSW